MTLAVQLLADDKTLTLEQGQIVVVPAGDVIVIVQGPEAVPIRLDGRIRSFRSTSVGRLLTIDLTRSTGFHHLHVPPGHDFWFGSEDAKLHLQGIQQMLSFLLTQGLGWSGQLVFSNGTYLRDPHVIYGWLDQHADYLLSAAEQISIDPRRASTSEVRVTRRGGRRLALKKTLSFLRRAPNEYLEPTPTGPLRILEQTYAPRRIVVHQRTTTLKTPANERVCWMLTRVMSLLLEIIPELTHEADRQRCATWLERASRLQMHSTLSSIFFAASQRTPSPVASVEEIIDERYATSFRGATFLESATGWTASLVRMPSHAFVDYSDEIYQLFVACVLAKSLSLEQVHPAVGVVQPAFSGSEWDLYFNCVPPDRVLKSWRQFTDSPERYRPDIVLAQRGTPLILLGDAKYRRDGARASESSRTEVLSYLGAYGIKKAVIFYPPDPQDALKVHSLRWNEYLIAEFPISPVPGLMEFLATEIPRLLEAASVIPPWRS